MAKKNTTPTTTTENTKTTPAPAAPVAPVADPAPAPVKTALDLAVDILANPTADPRSKLYARFVLEADSTDLDTHSTIADRLNADSFNEALITFISREGVINWDAFINGVVYPVLVLDNATEPTALKSVKVSDFLALKASKRSPKLAINGQLYSLLDMFGANLSTEYHQTRKQDTDTDILYLSKYTTALDGFTAENPASMNSLEKQLQTILDTLCGADHAPKVKKMYVRHLSDRFTKATRSGYGNGNALALLQEIIYHALDMRLGNKYEVKGKLEAQKPEKTK